MRKFTQLCLSALLASAVTTQAQVVTWQSVYTNTSGSMSLASTQSGDVFAAKGNVLLHSTAAATPGSFTTMTSPAANGSLYAFGNLMFMVDYGGKGVLRSTDFGATWHTANSGMIGSDSEHVTRLFYMGGTNFVLLHHGSSVNKIYVSNDNGMSWSATLNMFSQSGLYVYEKGGSYYLVTSGTVYQSTDLGGSWNNLNVTFSGGSGNVQVMSDGTMLMGAVGLFSSTDGTIWLPVGTSGLPAGATFQQMIKSPASDSLFASIYVASTSSYALMYSANKGMTWAAYDNGLPSSAYAGNSSNNTMHIAYDGYMYMSAENGDVYRTQQPVTASRVVPVTGIGNITDNTNNLLVYPNPAAQTLNVNFAAQGKTNIRITNLLGNVVGHQSFTANGATTQSLDISYLPAGNYFLSLYDNAGVHTARFMKQ
ncbi:MAG: T9SS type A sorting domain-containing protein [Bacteroidetes bacterium]|nr:T9SS type A sorting domain-containing protein [Bacteroidota bacterium]